MQFPVQLNIKIFIFWSYNLVFHFTVSQMALESCSPVFRVMPFYVSGLLSFIEGVMFMWVMIYSLFSLLQK